jgi:hypothetical protein
MLIGIDDPAFRELKKQSAGTGPVRDGRPQLTAAVRDGGHDEPDAGNLAADEWVR